MNKGSLIITVGISGSGKSTFAHERWTRDNYKYVIVNRDKIRELLFGFTEQNIDRYYIQPNISSLEKQVTRYEDTLINDGLNHGKTVIVDATHLTRAYIERFRYWNVPVEVHVFDIDYNEAVNRDLLRHRQVGDVVISKQYNRFNQLAKDLRKSPIDFTPVDFPQNEDNTRAVLFDIDGTLAHMTDRSPYDWDRVGEDLVDYPTLKCLEGLSKRFSIIICTGRDGICLEETSKWLYDNGIHWDEMFIRDRGDQRPDWVVKEEMWRKIAQDYYIVGMFDDRLQVVRRARSLGLKVFNVEYGNF